MAVRQRIGSRMIVASIVLSVGVATAAADIAARPPEPDPVASRHAVFRVTGRVRGLYPGIDRTMRVRIRNPHAFPIRVKRVRVVVSDASPACPASTIRIARGKPARPIRPRRTTKLRLRVRMVEDAPAACAGARYPLRFSGKAVRA
jgi:hypothetical protein